MALFPAIEIDREIKLVPFTTKLQATSLFRLIHKDPEHANNYGEGIATRYPNPQSLYSAVLDPENELVEWYVIQQTNGIVGSIAARPINERLGHYDIGYWVGSDHTNRGYAKRSAKALVDNLVDRDTVQLVTGVVHVNNAHSRAVLRYAGLTDVQPRDNNTLTHQLATRNIPTI